MNLAIVGYALAAVAFAALGIYCIFRPGGRAVRILLIVAGLISAAWAGINALWVQGVPFTVQQIYLAEIIRDAAWLILLAGMIPREGAFSVGGLARLAAYAGTLVALAATPFLGSGPATGFTLIPLGLGSAVFGLVMVEQIFRNADSRQRWVLKFLLLGIGAILAYDLFLYSHALLFRAIHADLWAIRGFANALVVPMLLVAVRRSRRYEPDLSVSRHVTFYTAALMGVGAYLLAMAAAGYGIRLLGGTWGGALQALFLFGAVVLLAIILLSSRVRSEVRVFISKHFYPSRYDYREEWMRLTKTLGDSSEVLPIRAIRAVAQIVEAESGALWVDETGPDRAASFRKVAHWKREVGPDVLTSHDGLVQFAERTHWSIHGNGCRETPDAYPGLELPAWLAGIEDDWVAVPLLEADHLYGLVLLEHPRTGLRLDYEEIDLLRIAGRQTATALAQDDANRKLADSRQFEAYNRLTAFLMHDLKNLIAQQSLVVRNAARFKHDPAFIDDAIETIGGSVRRMQRLLELLSQKSDQGYEERVAIAPMVERVIKTHEDRVPAPVAGIIEDGLRVTADPERLAMVLGHVIRNAQDATRPDGEVCVEARRSGRQAVILVRDTGAGMDPEFLRERLFRPFDSTKGAKGMGIGAYQVREFVEGCGGAVQVESCPGEGTTFRLSFPVADSAAKSTDTGPAVPDADLPGKSATRDGPMRGAGSGGGTSPAETSGSAETARSENGMSLGEGTARG